MDVAKQAPADFTPGQVREELLAHGRDTFVSAGDASQLPALAAYLRLYGLDRLAPTGSFDHQLAVMDCVGESIVVHRFLPPQPRGSAIILHGYYDHAGIYLHLIRHCLDKGWAVLLPDFPGHGLSSGPRASIDSFDRYLDTAKASLALAADELPAPRRLFGQSMGGAVAMDWLLRDEARGLPCAFVDTVLLAPLIRPFQWGVNRIVFNVVKHFISERPRAFTDNAENPEFLAFLRDRDVLQPTTLPVRWVEAMVDWMERFLRGPSSQLAPIVVQGHRDETVDHAFNLTVLRQKFARATIHEIPEARHHLVNESAPLRARIFACIDASLTPDKPADAHAANG